MIDWYYESNGERIGPISADEMKKLQEQGVLGATDLVWTAAFGSDWRQYSDTELAPRRAPEPPPLPPRKLQPTPPITASSPADDDFFVSDITAALVGKRQDFYLAKWGALLKKAGGDATEVSQAVSWNWPALFVPYAWLLYRKMYALGAIMLAAQVAVILLPDAVPDAAFHVFGFAVFGCGILTALYGNSWYFVIVRKRWGEMRQEPDRAAALARAKRVGGVVLVPPIAAVGLVVAAATLPYLATGFTDDTARLVRDGHMTNYATTTIGEAFAANFDEPQWTSFMTDTGATVVSFTGKINMRLHAKAVAHVANVRGNLETVGSPQQVDTAEFYYLFNAFQSAYAQRKDSPELRRPEQKYACSPEFEANLALNGMMADCGSTGALPFLREAIRARADEAVWPVGTPVSVQWTIHLDGQSFSLTHMSSQWWNGVPFETLLTVIYE